MIALEVVGFIAGLIAVLGFIFAIAKWVIKIDANTIATVRLTEVLEGFMEKVTTTLVSHGDRLTRLETKYEYFENGQMKSFTTQKVQQPQPYVPSEDS